MGNEPPALPPLPVLLGAHLEVLAHQIWRGLGSNPTMSNHCQMFYMLANVHHQIIIDEVLPPLDRFWYYLMNLPFRIQNTVASF
jgi:hypothetical protein